VNFYPFHLGDYAAHTSYLEPLEDLAYRRMLDLYYMREGALPADPAEIARIIRMRAHQAEVEVVLRDFFVKSDDGWHNKRADQELTAMLAKQEQAAAKNAHEAERMSRYRERRAVMFAALRAVGIVPAWDVKMGVLQELYNANCNAPEMDLQREQDENGNGPATAIPIPIPTPVVVGNKKQPDPADNCPHQEIVALFHDVLPEACAVRVWTAKRRETLRARWREQPKRQNLEWWRRVFEHIRRSDFLMGKVHAPGRNRFELKLEWLINEENLAKVIEGHYDNREEVAA
jgi:uncharacterized protein YdaU (DUF1376 family)